jgi:hypothetical protein
MNRTLANTVSLIIKEDANVVLQRSFTNTVEQGVYVEQALQVAAGAVDVNCQFGNMTSASVVYIESDQVISIKINGITNPAITIRDVAFLSSENITSIHISNATATIANVKVFLA